MTYSLTKVFGFGSTLGCDPLGGTSYAVLGAIVDGWEVSEAKSDEIDTAVMSDKYRTFAAGQADPGQVTFVIAYDPVSGSSAAILGALLTSGAVATWQETFNRGGSTENLSFSGPVVGLSEAVKKNALVTQNITVKKSGNPGYIGT